MASDGKIGVLACCGEECLGGALSRMATRMVWEKLCPDKVVTLWLPLFIAGGEGERKFAQQHPVISVEGCREHCARCATESYSGPVVATVDVEEALGEEIAMSKKVSLRDMGPEERLMAEKIALLIKDKLLEIDGRDW